ncbi:uracil-DNA glycosylase [Rhizobium sp. TH2]|uniref:uracil-DNA glycosylase n=1 Tax=Rhizobium sp. TH2 TaxID=2775403 RepID=UPI00215789EC|nr:uracil-DNA glycosylase [Rhizobium sp. TH2]UVC09873.1 uracil-DNA glycosylase [Rhizobium sp. TH2]
MSAVLEGWHADLPQAWRNCLGHVELGFDAMEPALDMEIWEPIFPVRKGRHFPGQPPGAHMLRAFDGIEPHEVRCVILGQDPYPEPGFATGRAFEAGNVADWRELDKMFSKSIRAYMQLILAARTGQPDYAESFDRWPDVREMITAPETAFESPSAIADRWVGQGVLLLNASLTLTRFQVSIDPHQSQGHLPLWRPLMIATIEALAARGQPLVVLGFGDAAAEVIKAAGIRDGQAGRLACVLRDHPARAEAVLAMPNPFVLCNNHLAAMGAAPIGW